jgi:hypothetical protein
MKLAQSISRNLHLVAATARSKTASFTQVSTSGTARTNLGLRLELESLEESLCIVLGDSNRQVTYIYKRRTGP